MKRHLTYAVTLVLTMGSLAHAAGIPSIKTPAIKAPSTPKVVAAPKVPVIKVPVAPKVPTAPRIPVVKAPSASKTPVVPKVSAMRTPSAPKVAKVPAAPRGPTLRTSVMPKAPAGPSASSTIRTVSVKNTNSSKGHLKCDDRLPDPDRVKNLTNANSTHSSVGSVRSTKLKQPLKPVFTNTKSPTPDLNPSRRNPSPGPRQVVEGGTQKPNGKGTGRATSTPPPATSSDGSLTTGGDSTSTVTSGTGTLTSSESSGSSTKPASSDE